MAEIAADHAVYQLGRWTMLSHLLFEAFDFSLYALLLRVDRALGGIRRAVLGIVLPKRGLALRQKMILELTPGGLLSLSEGIMRGVMSHDCPIHSRNPIGYCLIPS